MSKNGLMGWFKRNILRMSDDKSTVDISKIELPRIKGENVKRKEGESLPPFQQPKTIKLVNDSLTVVMEDGRIYSKTGATVDDFLTINAAKSHAEFLSVFHTQEHLEEVEKQKEEKIENEKKETERKIIVSSFDALSSYNNMFIVKESSVYLNREGLMHRSIPKLLVEKFAALILNMQEIENSEILEEYGNAIETLVRFWEKCCLCPNAQSAEDLYGFLEKHKMKIDQHGNFYAYRRVVRIGNATKLEEDLVDFISNSFNKVKAVWKKKPINFDVYQKGKEFRIVDMSKLKGEIKAYKIGNLNDLYLSIGNMEGNRFTDEWTKKQDYRVGEIISMPREKGNPNNNESCSFGYHVASKEYDYSSYGNTPILAIISPVDVLAVPRGEIGKMRVCRWFFAMTLDPKEEHILDDDRFDVRHLGDVFEDKCLADLDAHVKKIFAEEVKRHSFNLPEMTEEQIKLTVKSLEDIKNDLGKRVQKAV